MAAQNRVYPAIRCPKCQHLNEARLSETCLLDANDTCLNGHHFPREHDVLVLADDDLRAHVDAIYRFRSETQATFAPLSADAYDSLPCGVRETSLDWRLRCYDLEIVQRLLHKRSSQVILELGAWNGWLSHNLAKMGHTVTAAEYATHPTNGLGAKQFYNADWLAIQADLTDTRIFQPEYDVVIVNHGLHLFPDPVGYVEQVKQLVKPGGMLMLLMLIFFRDASARKAQIEAQNAAFQAEHGLPYFLKPTRAYMDFDDKRHIGRHIRLMAYPHLWRANLKARFRPTAPMYFYGVTQSQ